MSVQGLFHRRGVIRYEDSIGHFCLDEGSHFQSLLEGETIGIRIGARYHWGFVETDNQNRCFIVFSAPKGKPQCAFQLRRGWWYDARANPIHISDLC